MKRLRALSSVVDSPDVTAPEQHMRVHDYVSEMLSYNLPIFTVPVRAAGLLSAVLRSWTTCGWMRLAAR